MPAVLPKLAKLVRLLADRRFRPGLRRGVAATIEHLPALAGRPFRQIVDIGANKGQFTLLMAGLCPVAEIWAFEPLAAPFARLRQVTGRLPRVQAIQAAIGPVPETRLIYVSKREDSSSLLPITAAQEAIFPATGLARTDRVEVAPLTRYLTPAQLPGPALLKIDVQGFEREVLAGCGPLLERFAAVYVEASFLQLYEGQALADEVVDLLHGQELRLAGIYNLSQTAKGQAVQADFLFLRQPRPTTGAADQAGAGLRPAMIAS